MPSAAMFEPKIHLKCASGRRLCGMPTEELTMLPRFPGWILARVGRRVVKKREIRGEGKEKEGMGPNCVWRNWRL